MKRILVSISWFFLPALAFAQVNTTYSGGTGLGGLLKWFSGILSLAVPIIIALAVVWFIWGVFMYAIAGDEEAKGKAKGHIIWGIIGLAIMVSVWGLVGFLTSTFSLNNTAVSGPVIPTIQ
jgi:hypothetical protein